MTTQFKPGGATTPAATNGNIASRITGISRETRAEDTRKRCAKARMKVVRYKARGTIQRNGMEPTFSAMWLVTASIRAEGINAAASQKSFRRRAKLPSSAEEGTAAAERRLGWCWSINGIFLPAPPRRFAPRLLS